MESSAALEHYLSSDEYDPPLDGINLVQEYIEPSSPTITRLEFIGRELLYAVRVDTRDGFELCPADSCQASEELCPASEAEYERFEIDPSFDAPLVGSLQGFLAVNEIAVAAVEFIEDASGRKFVYDVNTNTNYNRAAEEKAGMFGMQALAGYLGHVLEGTERVDTRMALVGAREG